MREKAVFKVFLKTTCHPTRQCRQSSKKDLKRQSDFCPYLQLSHSRMRRVCLHQLPMELATPQTTAYVWVGLQPEPVQVALESVASSPTPVEAVLI